MPSANSLWARDRFLPRLRLHAKLDPYRFEMFTAGLLQAMGYRAEVTPASGDGGVDVIASRDPLAIEPPIIKVQCKRTTSTIGAPIVQALIGTLAPGGTERALGCALHAKSRTIRRFLQTLKNLSADALFVVSPAA